MLSIRSGRCPSSAPQSPPLAAPADPRAGALSCCRSAHSCLATESDPRLPTQSSGVVRKPAPQTYRGQHAALTIAWSAATELAAAWVAAAADGSPSCRCCSSAGSVGARAARGPAPRGRAGPGARSGTPSLSTAWLNAPTPQPAARRSLISRQRARPDHVREEVDGQRGERHGHELPGRGGQHGEHLHGAVATAWENPRRAAMKKRTSSAKTVSQRWPLVPPGAAVRPCCSVRLGLAVALPTPLICARRRTAAPGLAVALLRQLEGRTTLLLRSDPIPSGTGRLAP